MSETLTTTDDARGEHSQSLSIKSGLISSLAATHRGSIFTTSALGELFIRPITLYLLYSPRSTDLSTIEGLGKLRESLISHISSSSVRAVDKTAQQINLAIVNAMDQMNKRLNAIEGRLEKVDQNIDEKLQEQDDKVNEHSVLLDVQFDAIRGLSLQAQLLEGIALGVRHHSYVLMTADASVTKYRPFIGALAIRRHLDQARHAITWAFIEVFPQKFPRVVVLHYYQSGSDEEKGVNWRKFRNALGDLYMRYHKVTQTSKKPKRFVLEQCYSCMESEEPFLMGAKYDTNLSDLFSFFRNQPIRIENCNEEGWVNESSDRSLSRLLNFFVPIMIWEFSKAKMILVDIDKEIFSKQEKLRFSTLAIRNIAPDYVFPEFPVATPGNDGGEDRFELGTCLEIRMQQLWQEYVERRTQRLREKERQEREEKESQEREARQHRLVPERSSRYSRKRMRYEEEASVLQRFYDNMEDEDVTLSYGAPTDDQDGFSQAEPHHEAPNPPNPEPRFEGNLKDEDKLNDTMTQALRGFMDGTISDIRGLQEQRKPVSIRFDRLRKYLDIILDDDINEMTMYESSLLRRLTNDYAHMNEELQKHYQQEHLSRIDEVFQSAKKPVPDEDYKERLERLSTKLYNREDYYARKESSVERSVDDLISSFVAEMGSYKDDAPSDVQVLLSCFESLKPAKQSSPGA